MQRFFCTAKVFIKNTAIFIVVVGVVFSNIPYTVLTGAIDGYIKTANIVDRAWQLSQDDNVVDKFTSYRHLVEKVKTYEAYAATLSYVGGAEAAGNSAAYNVSLASLVGGTGGAAQTGDLVIVATGFVSTANGNPGVGTAGFTEVNGTDLYGNDKRDANFSVNYKIMGGVPDSQVSCNGSGSATNGAVCVVQVWRNADQTTPLDITATSATSNNSAVPNSPVITPITSGAVVLSLGAGTGAAADTSVTAPTGYTNQIDNSVDPGNAIVIGIASKSWSGSGAEDPAVWTTWTTSTSDSWGAYTLAIRPKNDPPTITIAQPDGVGDTVNVGDPYNITYDLADPDNVVTAAMYYDTDATGLNGVAITGACATAAEGTGATCSWDTTGMTPGNYYVYGITNDGVNPQVSDYSPGVITINAPASVLTVGTSGSQTTNLDSGVSNTYLGGALTFSINTGSASVTGIKVSNNGDAGNLSDIRLYYDIDGTYSGGESCFNTVCTDGGGGTLGSSIAGTLSMTSGNTYYVYAVADIANTVAGGKTVDIQITNPSTDVITGATNTDTVAKNISGTTTIRPNVTDATDSTLGDGGRNGETFTITGTGFGTACGSISVQVEGTTLTCNSANNTTISATVPVAQTTTYGGTGASGLLVTVGGTADDARQTYYVYPNVTSITGTPVSDAQREGSNLDINGTRFDSSGNQGTVTFTGNFGSVSASVVSWSDTLVTVTVPTAISDSVYTGDITLTRAAGTGSKTDTAYGGNTFRVLPRITSLVNSTDSVGAAITVNGDHFCQSGTCPGSFSPGVNAVTFTSGVDATVFTSWSNTAIATVIPAGTISGNVVVTSNTDYTSNGSSFTVLSLDPDNADLTIPRQYKNSGLTQAVAVGGVASSTSIYLTMTMQAGVSGGTLYPQIEYKAVGTAFSCSGSGSCASATEGSGVAGPGPVDCSTFANGCAVAASPNPAAETGEVYHWQARVCHNKDGTHTSSCGGTGDHPSASWVSYDNGSPESSTDFKIDIASSTITTLPSAGTPGTNGATITWATANEQSTSRVEYDTAGTFTGGYDCAGTSECTSLDATVVNNHSVILSNLDSGTTYTYRVRSKDAAGNETISSNYTFATQSISEPAKMTRFHIVGKTGSVTNGAPLSQSFSVFMPEEATTTKSIFAEIEGVYVTSGSPTISVQVNSETSKTYTLPSASATSHFKILHQVNDVVVETADANTLTVTPSSGTTVYVTSADINVSYSYTP